MKSKIALSAILTLMLGVVTVSPASASRPRENGGNLSGYFLYTSSTYAQAGKVAFNVVLANGCAAPNYCGQYDNPGGATVVAGNGYTNGDTLPGPNSRTVGYHAQRMYNNQNGSQRAACAYYWPNYDGGGGYRRVNFAGTGWVALPFTGASSQAAIPQASNWVCW